MNDDIKIWIIFFVFLLVIIIGIILWLMNKSKVKYVILDTHVYRKIGRIVFRKLNEEERNMYFHNWRQNEKENGLEGCSSLLVAMELISHLKDKEDPAYEDCKNAIKVLARHSPNNFIPPPDIYFSKIFFDFESIETNNFCSVLGDIISEIANNEPPYSEKTETAIRESSEMLERLEELMLTAIKQGVAPTNPDGNDKNLFKEKSQQNKERKRKLRNTLKKEEKYIEHQAKSFIQRIAEFCSIQLSDISATKYNELILFLTENHSSPFLLIREINEQLLQPEYKLEKKVNDLTDILILFGANQSENRFLVSAEKKIIKCGKGNVITEEEYLKICNLN